MPTLTEVSKYTYAMNEVATYKDIEIGCLQRIADATEIMAKGYNQIISDRKYYEKMYKRQQARSERLQRSNSALRGVITKMKKVR